MIRWLDLRDIANYHAERNYRWAEKCCQGGDLEPECMPCPHSAHVDTHPPVAEPDYAAVARAARRSLLAFYVASIPLWVLVGFIVGHYTT